MPKDSKQTRFIVSTPVHGGAWHGDRDSTYSLINSHLARWRTKTPDKGTRQSDRDSASDSSPLDASENRAAELEIFSNTAPPQSAGPTTQTQNLHDTSNPSQGSSPSAERLQHTGSLPVTTIVKTHRASTLSTARKSGRGKTTPQTSNKMKAWPRTKGHRVVSVSDITKLGCSIGDALDPFMLTAIDVSAYERQLLQFCKIDTSRKSDLS
jgi:hypothetical protein